MCNIALLKIKPCKKIYIMRTLAISLLLLLVNISSFATTKTMRDMIRTMPKEMIPYLQDEQWAEVYKFIESKDTLKIKNGLNGITSFDLISNDFANIGLNEITSMQIKLLTRNDSTEIICLVKTINRPVKESTVQFFSTEWEEIEDDFNLPQAKDTEMLIKTFVERPDSISEDKFMELLSRIDPVIINADISSKNNTITYNLSLPFIREEEKEEIKAIIKQNTFKWDGSKFKKC